MTQIIFIFLNLILFVACSDSNINPTEDLSSNSQVLHSSSDLFSSSLSLSSSSEQQLVESSSLGSSSFILSSSISSSAQGPSSSSSDLWTYLSNLPNTWYYRARETYVDSDLNNPTSHNSEIYAFKALGSAIPSVGGIPNTANLIWSGRMDFQSPEAPIWYAEYGHKPTFVDRGNHDEYVRFTNGLPTNYETQPGSLTPAIAQGENLHLLFFFRAMPSASYEAFMAAPSFKDRSGDGQQMLLLYQGTNLYGNSGFVSNWGEDNLLEISYHQNGDVEMILNGDAILTGNLPSLPQNGFSEFILGTNSHVASHHFRTAILRTGEFFSAPELDSIRALSQQLWPRNVKPNFPYLDNQYTNNYSTWNSVNKSFEPKLGNFTGGSGIAGTHIYQWYYWEKPDSLATWPRNNCLDYHLAFPGAQGKNQFLIRADYEAGNPYGNPVIFSEPGNKKVKVMRVVTPVDNIGTQGEPLPGAWYLDENS